MTYTIPLLHRLLFTLEELFDGAERTIFYADAVELPKPIDEQEFVECCYCYDVFASSTTSDIYKNDYNGFYFQQQTSTDDCIFVLVEENGTEHPIINNTYGVYRDFGSIESNLKMISFILLWKNVINTLGIGIYHIRKDITIAGVSVTETSLKYNLQEFSYASADGTIRLDCMQNGNLRHLNTNFTGTELIDSIRINGFFGNRIPTFETDNIVYSNDVSVLVGLKQTNEYILESEEVIPIELSERIYNFFLMSNDLWINDYNSDNHSLKYIRKEIELKENDTINYYRNNRNVKFSIKFADKIKNIRNG